MAERIDDIISKEAFDQVAKMDKGLSDLIKRFEVRRVQVKEWQDAVLGKRLAKGMTKVAALAAANKLWPTEQWLATSRSKTPHDGIIDAALIAYYNRDHQLL